MKCAVKIVGVILLAFACTKHSDKTTTFAVHGNDSLTYAIVNLVLTDTSIYGKDHRILSTSASLPPPKNYNGTYVSYVSHILSETDTICIARQLTGGGKFTTTKMAEYGFTVVDLDTFRGTLGSKEDFWERFHERYGDGFLTVSKPIFDCEGTRVFIRIGYVCDSLCGGGTDLLLEKGGERWILKEKLSSWVS